VLEAIAERGDPLRLAVQLLPREPGRDAPFAVLSALALSAVLYALVQASALAAVPGAAPYPPSSEEVITHPTQEHVLPPDPSR